MQYLGSFANGPCPPASSRVIPPLADHHVVFPDLRPAGPRHVVNFAPPSASGERRRSSASCSDEEAFCLRWIFRQAGLNLHDYRPETIERRLPALLRTLGVGSLPEARSLLRANPALVAKAMDAILIGVTSFFRDPEVFEALRSTAIPELSCRDVELRIWGTACSDGLELTSLALMLAESGLLHRARLLGTDCRESAVLNARRAVFSADDVCAIGKELHRRHFVLRDGVWCMSCAIKNHMHWRKADLLREIEPGPWDMILCRNFAMYLRNGAVIELWMRLRRALRPGGFLVTGKAERPGRIREFRQVGPCLYRREE
jgi:chemotaxis methyl-accepting protein methylase